jgi:SAM-dependent methyltransferase
VSRDPDVALRRAFLDERRRICERRMDVLHAPIYDERWGSYINRTHRRFVDALLSKVGPAATVLDAACGTGKYWPIVCAADVQIIGVDLSRAMLAAASRKHPQVPVVHGSLQHLSDRLSPDITFDGLLCIDAMENVGPEDWSSVLDQFSLVLRPGGSAYLTVEIPERDIEMDDEAESAPLVPGEVLEDGGYHFYPDAEQVRGWLQTHDLNVLDQASACDGDQRTRETRAGVASAPCEPSNRWQLSSSRAAWFSSRGRPEPRRSASATRSVTE